MTEVLEVLVEVDVLRGRLRAVLDRRDEVEVLLVEATACGASAAAPLRGRYRALTREAAGIVTDLERVLESKSEEESV